MKSSKFIWVLTGAAVAGLIAILYRKFKSSETEPEEEHALANQSVHRNHKAKNFLRKAMDKASHIKQEHNSTDAD